MTEPRTIAAAALTKASAYDPRQRAADPLILDAWTEAVSHHGLDHLPDALDAVRVHYDQPKAPPMLAGDLTSLMRAARRDRGLRRPAQLEQAAASPEVRAKMLTRMRGMWTA